jgi:hypothetical protein
MLETKEFHHNETQSRLRCSCPLLPLFSLWSWICCGCSCALPVAWTFQHHSSLCCREHHKRMLELYHCSHFCWYYQGFLDADPLHLGGDGCWNEIGEPRLSARYVPPCICRQGYLEICRSSVALICVRCNIGNTLEYLSIASGST